MIIQPTQGEVRVIEKEGGTPVVFSELQEIIGGYVEFVPFTIDGKQYTMVVDEDGRIKELPLNVIASLIRDGLPIVGTACIIVNTDDPDEFTWPTQEEAQQIFEWIDRYEH